MRVRLLEHGDETSLIEAALLFNDLELARRRATEMLHDPSFVMVVAETETGQMMGRIYGHVLKRLDRSDLFIYEVDVADEYQRQGAGRAMLEFLSDLCRSRGYGEWFVLTECSNAAGNALYRSAGGVVEGSPANVYAMSISNK